LWFLDTGYATATVLAEGFCLPGRARPVSPTDVRSLMFESIANLVTRRGWVILLGWLLAAVTLFAVAPSWYRVSRDDDVRFFPAGSPSVVGQDLLEQGFPSDAASSQVVVIGERRQGSLTQADFDFLDKALVPLLNNAREREPNLGIKRVDTHLTPVIGARLL